MNRAGQQDVVILAAKRTPFGTFGGALKDLSATDLGVHAAKAAVAQAGVPPEDFGHVVIGNVAARGDQVTVEMRLYDATLGTLMTGRRYTGSARMYRKMAHKFSNEVLYAFTGARGIFDSDIAFSARPGKGKGKEIFIVGITSHASTCTLPDGTCRVMLRMRGIRFCDPGCASQRFSCTIVRPFTFTTM